MMINKVVGVVMGGLMMIAAVVLLAFFHDMFLPCLALGLVGYLALRDSLDDSDEDTEQINRGR